MQTRNFYTSLLDQVFNTPKVAKDTKVPAYTYQPVTTFFLIVYSKIQSSLQTSLCFTFY